MADKIKLKYDTLVLYGAEIIQRSQGMLSSGAPTGTIEIPVSQAKALIEKKAVIVPIEPTEKQLEAGMDKFVEIRSEYEDGVIFGEIWAKEVKILYKAMIGKE